MTVTTSDEFIEQLTQCQPVANQKAFRDTLQSIVRLAKSEARNEALMNERDALAARSLH